ncbi:purine-binding chemotaxis protein CheW [Candidatus Sulfurimonas marisnigri]|uniref:Purine-binding chemotaxis protein CheW n=1 Tax=Candidatus Sulfurimonas marisnigri TaxID=2740405 RepID=A0A7S7M2U4_9BACT|nr:chemotaxis protein CheW [Candidatus Sulfurimonas marisnigri]QOY55294.1 purine-binding chemotaxis protein CheW [Candidatus Sulfurimonas marisnigri]
MSTANQDSSDNQFLTFYVAGEIYALSVLHIKEIIEYSIVTKVPLMQECVSGITNIRGSVIPVIDLGIRLNISHTQTINKRTSIIVIEKEDEIQNFQVGLVVDEVNEVYDIITKEQEDAPVFGSKIRKEFIEHIGKVKGSFIPILNSSELVNIEELSKVNNAKDA